MRLEEILIKKLILKENRKLVKITNKIMIECSLLHKEM